MLLEEYREKQLYIVGRVERETTVCRWKGIEKQLYVVGRVEREKQLYVVGRV